jgi:translation elongation factor EF-Tu-like GTPase
MYRPSRKDAEAEITYFSPENGGRKTVFSGYRGEFHYDGNGWDAIQTFETEGPIPTGQTIKAVLTFTSPEAHRKRLFPGKQFEIREGKRLVGVGKITQVFFD